MESLDLFVRPSVTIDGLVPAFTLEETLMGYSYRKYKPGRFGLGCYDDSEYSVPQPDIEESSIVVDGKKCVGKMNFYRGSNLEIAMQIANEILASPEPKFIDGTAWKWLKENEVALKKSFRYWKAMERVKGIKEAEAKAAALQQQIRLGKILASVDAIQLHEDRIYDALEYHRACREFGMTEVEIAQVFER